MNADIRPILEFDYKLIYYNNLICIKGNYAVSSYEDSLLILKCAKDNLCIQGKNIAIDSLDVDEIHISGKIEQISFA